MVNLVARGLHLQIVRILTSCDFCAIPSYDPRGFKLATNKTEYTCSDTVDARPQFLFIASCFSFYCVSLRHKCNYFLFYFIL